MSTKIYNGALLQVSTFKEIDEFITYLTKEFDKQFDFLFKKQLMEKLVYNYDEYLLNDNNKEIFVEFKLKEDKIIGDRTTLVTLLDSYLTEKMNKVSKDSSLTRDPSNDFTFQSSFWFLDDKILVNSVFEQPEYGKTFFNYPKVKDYAYWDNSDPSENCTAEEWNQRCEDWDKIDKKPSLQFKYRTNTYMFYTLDYQGEKDVYVELLKYQPSFEDRLNRISKNKVISDLIKQNTNQDDSSFEKCFDAMNHLKTEEGKMLLENKKGEIRKVIPEKITLEIIKKTWKEL